MRRTTTLSLALALALSSCGSESSSSYTTDKIKADMHVDVDNIPGQQKTEIYVFLKDGFTDITLGDGDTLTAKTSKDERLVLTKSEFSFYKVKLDAADRGDDFTVAFTRTNGTSAPNSTIKVPAAIALTAPAGSPKPTASFAAGNVTLEWSNKLAGARLTWYTRTCGTVSGSLGSQPSADDSGKITFTMSDLGITSAPPAEGTCISIDLTRSVTTGKVDSAFRGTSSFEGKRSDRYDIQVMP
jgi:hypothetical protein